MAGSVNKVILIGNLGKDPEIRRTQDGRPIANLRIATSEILARQDHGRAAREDRVALGRHLQREPLQDRRAVPEEGLEGVHRGRAADAQVAGPGGQDRYSTEVVLQGFNGNLTMLDGRSAAREPVAGMQENGQADYGGDSCGEARPRAAARARRRRAASTSSSTTRSRSNLRGGRSPAALAHRP